MKIHDGHCERMPLLDDEGDFVRMSGCRCEERHEARCPAKRPAELQGNSLLAPPVRWF